MRSLFAGVTLVLLAAPVAAQDLRSTITQLFTYGDCGAPLCLELGDEHGNHFIPAVTAGNQTVLSFLTEAIGRTASNVPLSATSSGATFTLVGGLPVRTSTSAGPIFAERAKAVTVSPFKGPKYFPINDAMQQALTRIEDGSATPEASWEKFVADVQALG